MQCIRAKTNHLIRKQAIRHYLHEKRADTFTFMGLWNDEEPYPLVELMAVQQVYIEQMKSELIEGQVFTESQIRSEELTLQRLQALQKHFSGSI